MSDETTGLKPAAHRSFVLSCDSLRNAGSHRLGPVDTFPVIQTSKANEYQVFLGGQSVNVPVEGVVYVHPDGRQKLFFWNQDRFADIELTASADTTAP